MPFNPQPGDCVTIRTWDDMAEEYGLNINGEIKTPFITILKGMKQFCGHSYIVKEASIHLLFLRLPFFLPYLCSCRLFFLPAVHSPFPHLF